MTDRYISDRTEDLVDRHGPIAIVTQGLGYFTPGQDRCVLTDTGNGFVAKFPAHNSTTQDYYLCMDYSQARDIVLALSMFKSDLGFKEAQA
jgi:hypothetical protein